MNFRRLLAVARKEILHLLRDWRSLMLALGISVILILLYGYALTLDLRQVSTVIWDQSRSSESRKLLRVFHSSSYFTVTDYRDSYSGLQQSLDSGVAMVAMVIPGDFSAKVGAGKPLKSQIIGDSSDANTSRLSMNYVANIGAIYARGVGSERMQLKGWGELQQPMEMQHRSWYNPGLRSQNVLIPGIIALVMIVVAALLTSTTIAKEWEICDSCRFHRQMDL